MSISTVVSDNHLKKFIEVTDDLSAAYAERLQPWVASPFAWIITLPSRTRGAIGEKIVANWLYANGCIVLPPPHSGCDRVVNGIKMEIKFSTLWENGDYVFQQLRDQDYASLFCLGLSPGDVHAWLIPKAVAWERAIPQHGGNKGKDTKWLRFPVGKVPSWMEQYGGSLAGVLEVIRSAGGK